MIATLIRDYGPAIPWALVVWGWFLSNKHANRRELRKETRAELDRLISSIRQLADANRDYAMAEVGSADEANNGLAIKLGFARISASLERLSRHLKSLDDVDRRIAKFYEEVTGGDFESSTRQCRSANDSSFIVTSAIAENLIDALEKAYWQQFP